jgi:peptide-methionine (R)-S-oxide reductase
MAEFLRYPIDGAHVRFVRDTSYGMMQTEIRCTRYEGHLGRVFDDGPPARHCMNSVSMQFVSLPGRLDRGALKNNGFRKDRAEQLAFNQ